jgi:hypothetical protein
MSLSMAFPVMLVVEEEIFITAVDRKRHSRDAQAREASLESIPSREGSCVSPRLSRLTNQQTAKLLVFWIEVLRSRPWVVCR